MNHYTGVLGEVLLEAYQNASARLVLPAEAVPAPGQYLHATHLDDEWQALPVTLFPAGLAQPLGRGQVSLPVLAALPAGWAPGARLALRGPLGRGFQLPRRAKRMALASLHGSPACLLPLASLALAQGAEVALSSPTLAASELPPAIEVHALQALPRLLAWADCLALDLRREDLDGLEAVLGGRPPRSTPAQALVRTAMPCGSLAACGVCAVSAGSKQRFACQDGPVFPLTDLLPNR